MLIDLIFEKKFFDELSLKEKSINNIEIKCYKIIKFVFNCNSFIIPLSYII
jgi:hypothetical protein